MALEEQPASTLPPLLETFPAETYPLREVGTGFTAQSVHGAEANKCAASAAEMLTESRTMALSATSTGSDEGSTSSTMGVDSGEQFIVPGLPLPEGESEDGMLILRNESLFPGMVGISLPRKGVLWVREDGTFNSSGFFRRQIPKFETAALVAATASMKAFLDVYHALYRCVVERAAQAQQYKILRTVIEAGLGHYGEDSATRTELLEVRRRVKELRARTKNGKGLNGWQGIEGTGSDGAGAGPGSEATNGNADGGNSIRSRPSLSSEISVEDTDLSASDSGKYRISRCGSDSDRPAKIAQQVVQDAPKQKEPFRLWKNKTGTESYSRSLSS